MSDVYTVAVKVDLSEKGYALTNRCIAKNTRWHTDGKRVWEDDGKKFNILFEGSKKEARQFSANIQAAYALAGLNRLLVKAESETDTDD